MNGYEGHISASEGIIMVFAVLSSELFVEFPALLVRAGGPAAWQLVLVMTLAGLALFLPTVWLAHRFPQQGLAEIATTVAGPAFGGLLALIAVGWLVLNIALSVRSFAEAFIVGILPNTPPSMLIFIAMVCAAYASYQGLESLARTAQIFFPVILGGSLILVLFSISLGNVSLLFPFWGRGVDITIVQGLANVGATAEAFVLIIFGYAFRKSNDVRTAGLMGILLYGLTATLTVSVLVMVLGGPDASQTPFPLVSVARMFHLGRLFQRTEAGIVLFWFFTDVVRLSALLHAAVVLLSGTLRLPFYRPVILPVAFVAGTLSLIPKDLVTVLRLGESWVRPGGIALMGIPLMLIAVAALRNLGGPSHAA